MSSKLDVKSLLTCRAYTSFSDISWGTKGDNKVSIDLGIAKVDKDGKQAEVADISKTDIDDAYEDALHVLKTKPPKVEATVDEKTKQEDYYKTFRTK